MAAEYSEGKIIPIQGNIDSPATHKLIVDIMEGGQEAFERRQNDLHSMELMMSFCKSMLSY